MKTRGVFNINKKKRGEIVLKKKICKMLLLTALAAAGAMMLTACTSNEKSQTSSGTSGNGSSQTVSGTVTSDDTQQASGTQGSDAAQNIADSSQSSAADQSAGTAEQAGSSSDEPVGDVIPDEYADAAEAENKADDAWSGTYVSESETLTVTLVNDETISFAFAQSGISGTAAVDGSQAVFNGDDYHVVVFSLNGTVVNVAVSSEEDFDASGSPLNGTYVLSAN